MMWVGCSGWYYPHWRGIFYPDDLKKSKWFEYYCRHFNTVEINSTFYRIPKITTVRGWVRKTPEDFRISLKMNKQLTHMGERSVLKDFEETVSVVGEKLGCVLFQFPPSLKRDEEKLNEIIEMAERRGCRCAIEFRHRSWFEAPLELKGDVVMCFVSSPQIRSPSVFDEYVGEYTYAYVRFHGTSRWYRHLYTADELKEWAELIRKFDEGFVYFNNDFNAYAPKNALQMIELLKD